MIERIWASEPPYNFDGTYFNVHMAKTYHPGLGFGWLPKPYQQPRPPIVIPSSSADSQSVRTAGRKGWGVVSSQLLTAEGTAANWRNFCLGCEEAGRTPNGNDWRVCRSILVAATDEEARARAFHPEGGYRHFFGHMFKVFAMLGRLGQFKSRPDMRDEDVTVDTMIEQRLIYGSPKTVLDQLIALRKEAGPFGTLLLTAVDWGGPNAAWERESLSRIAQEVMPAFRERIAAAA
jgi:alkanesulfonate monooxygenase SsuD/methylene tetrahydromethanopterin reductase-like flavin-dependent oxidoreductase (luciferase family)